MFQAAAAIAIRGRRFFINDYRSPYTMARKPNYSFEKNSKAKAKAAKREAKRLAKLAAKTEKKTPSPMPGQESKEEHT